MKAKQFYENGELFKAIAAMNDEVKQMPQDIYKRDFLRELLCIAGELERADKQLDVIAQQDVRATVGAALVRQLIRAEQARLQCFKEGRVPEFIGEPTAALKWHLQALIELREGNTEQAYECLQKANAERLPVHGECDGVAFQNLRDLDDTCAGFFEVLTSNGKYYWVAFEQIKHIEFRAPERPTDLIWRRAHMTVNDGPEGEIYIPAIYVNTLPEDETARLGHKTDWQGDDNKPVVGIGQRLLLIGEEAVPIMEIQELIIHDNN